MTSAGGGTVGQFVSQPEFPWRADFAGLTPGSKEFSARWIDIANRFPDEFKRVEHDYIKRSHFDPLCASIKMDDGINVTQCSHIFQDVIWSTAVQHGPNTPAVHRAFEQMHAAGTFDPPATSFERDAIVAIYTERGRSDSGGTLVYFSRNSQAVQQAVAKRFRDEAAQALQLLSSNA